MTCRTGLPVPCRQCPGALCPTGRLPRFLTDPDGLTGRFLLCPTDPDGLTGPFRPDPPRQDPFRPYAQTGPGTGVQSCQALFFLSPARVRFYNAAVRGPIQIYVNNRLVVSNLNFLNYSRIYNVIPGRYRITVYRGNDMRSPLVDTWMSFQQNQDYTVALVGSGSNFQLQTFSF